MKVDFASRIDRRYDFIRLRLLNDLSPAAFEAGITSINFKTLLTSESSSVWDCDKFRTNEMSRLNHLMVLHIQKEATDKLNLIDVANMFIAGSEHRMTVFGAFHESDRI